MASNIFFVLLLRASLQYVEQDLKSVNKSDATFDSSVKRNKREAIVSNYSCPEGMSWLTYHCVENDQYNKSKVDDYIEMTEVRVENALSQPRTTQIPMFPYSEPTQTPRTLHRHTHPRSKHGPTKRHRKKPRPRPKSTGPATTTWPRLSSSGLETTPGPSLTSAGHPATLTSPAPSKMSGPVTAPVSRAETISATTVLFVLYLSVLQHAVLRLLISQDVT